MDYRVSMDEPHRHLFDVEARLERPGDVAVLALPVWTPGSYLVREFARNVEGVRAEDERGRPLRIERLDKQRFRLVAGGAARAVIRYRVYANDLTVRTSHLDGTHGYWNGASLFLYAEGREGEPCALEVVAPEGWRVSTALGGGPSRFTAPDYHALVDAPVEVGRHRIARFTALGKEHELAVWGEGTLDLERFAADVRRIVEHLGGLMGGLPYERYLFLVHLSEKRKGGLEHGSSTTLHVARTGFHPPDAYAETLSLVAHEFFHAWNVKRLKPRALLPYDYAREQYTRLLWWFEGVTSYYDHLALARAGFIDGQKLLQHLGEELTALARTPGARKMSPEEASFLAWVKLYRPDENSVNSGVSYYLAGECVAFALDLLLRRAGRSLDELLLRLYRRYGAEGVPEDGVEREVAELLGEDAARAFFDAHVRGTVPPTEALALEHLGLALHRRKAEGPEDKGGTPARPGQKNGPGGWLGVDLGGNAKLTVSAVRAGSPAERAGLYAEDEIIAEGGFKVDKAQLLERLKERGPSGELRLHVFRREALLEVRVPLAEPPEDTLWLAPREGASEGEREAFQRWCGAPWPAKREG
ncbi:M61 family metallopeptidase [Anaeromyxobacter paludicola]|uniref:Peptidase M61 n=1 Tax=Anaeromyxobacter paludicola TaxID=2918171 RepID=A0ABN6N979_9BACT|nr:M61 family peptidase [Anaeromyxobacter paludicola]BDG08669.1 peptidase M61 [Anaeromyxobacter paludicola]